MLDDRILARALWQIGDADGLEALGAGRIPPAIVVTLLLRGLLLEGGRITDEGRRLRDRHPDEQAGLPGGLRVRYAYACERHPQQPAHFALRICTSCHRDLCAGEFGGPGDTECGWCVYERSGRDLEAEAGVYDDI